MQTEPGQRCSARKFNTIRIETAEMATAPTVGSVRGDELPAVASSAPGYRAGKVVAATRKAGAVIVATYSNDVGRERGDGETVTLDVSGTSSGKTASSRS